MKSIPAIFLFVFSLLVWGFLTDPTLAMSCEQCGAECARACGTRHFRTCCFNYVRKRSSNFHPYALNRMNYDFLYGPPIPMANDNDDFQRNIKENYQNDRNIDNEVGIRNIYKPWKENEMDRQQPVPQVNSQTSDSKQQQSQQFVYDN